MVNGEEGATMKMVKDARVTWCHFPEKIEQVQ
jgi:hypothetical protein